MYISICIYICIHACIHIYIYMYMDGQIEIYMIYIYICVYVDAASRTLILGSLCALGLLEFRLDLFDRQSRSLWGSAETLQTAAATFDALNPES